MQWIFFCQPSRKAQGDNYSAFAIFTNPQEANQAFENAKGNQDKVHTI